MTLRRMLMPLAVLAALMAASLTAAQTNKKGSSSASRDNSDIEFVEKLLIARRDYQRSLELLRAHYVATGDAEKAKWAEDELLEYHRINHQAYRLDLDVPPEILHASTNIMAANDLIKRAKEYKDRGFGTNYIDNQRRAEVLLQELLTKYPTSNKISEAAYLLGDLYESKAYKQNRRAALYFERCFQWNPASPSDARLRAARIYDKVLPERGRAIEIYKDIVTHETDAKHIKEAQQRLQVLTGGK